MFGMLSELKLHVRGQLEGGAAEPTCPANLCRRLSFSICSRFIEVVNSATTCRSSALSTLKLIEYLEVFMRKRDSTLNDLII